MADHTKPTEEELQANIDNSLKEIETIVSASQEVPEENEETPVEIESVEENTESEVEPAPSDEVPEEEAPAEPEAEDDAAKKAEDEEKRRLVESQREALILNARNKKMNEAVELADSLPEPSELELRKESLEQGFDFDEMTETEKALFKRQVLTDRKLTIISNVTKEGKDIDEWNGKVDSYVENPETLVDHPKLEGKENDFKLFASKQSRRGVDFETLVDAFLYNVEANKPAPKKGMMMPIPTGGLKPKAEVQDKLTVEQGRALMDKDYGQFKKLLLAGKIETESV